MSPRTATATKVELSRAAVIERALDLIDAEGLDAVTIRRLAQEFGVTPMALYWHFANKDELLAAIGDSLFDDLTPPPAKGSWSAQLRAIVAALIDELSKHPGAAELVFPRVLVCANGLRLTEHTLALLADAGFTTQQAADVARTALQTALMLVTQQPGLETQAKRDEREAVLAEKRRHIEQLSQTQYPRVRASVHALTDCEDDAAYYRFGVDIFVEGVEAMLRRIKRDSR